MKYIYLNPNYSWKHQER